MHYSHKKAKWGSKIATFRKKAIHFFRVMRLNWLAKTKLRGVRVVFHIIVSYSSKQKMLKRNWNWRNSRLFWHIFVIGEILIGRGRVPWFPLWLRLGSNWGKQKRCSQIFREVSRVFQQYFNSSKNSAVLEPRTGQFSRQWFVQSVL